MIEVNTAFAAESATVESEPVIVGWAIGVLLKNPSFCVVPVPILIPVEVSETMVAPAPGVHTDAPTPVSVSKPADVTAKVPEVAVLIVRFAPVTVNVEAEPEAIVKEPAELLPMPTVPFDVPVLIAVLKSLEALIEAVPPLVVNVPVLLPLLVGVLPPISNSIASEPVMYALMVNSDYLATPFGLL